MGRRCSRGYYPGMIDAHVYHHPTAHCPEDGIMSLPLPDARHLSDEVLAALRLRALRGCEMGYTETELADLLGVARETVSRWWNAYAGGGLEAVPHDRSGRPTGAGRALDDDQARHLRGVIDTRA